MCGYLNKPDETAAVPVPDDLLGEEVKVHVLLGDGQSPESLPAAELIGFSADWLARCKVPRYVEYRTEDLERTPSMRVKKENLDRSALPAAYGTGPRS